MKNIQPDRA